MAKIKDALSNINLDWYLISVDTLKRLGLILLLIVGGVGGYLYYDYQQKSPRIRAEKAITTARESLETLASSKERNTFRLDYQRARTRLDEARRFLIIKKYPESESAAVESQTITQSALARIPGQKESDAQFLTVEGEVVYQKAGGDWKSAEVRTPLFNGDWVKTSGNSSAELMFSNGSLYTIGPNALLEIYSLYNAATSQKRNSVTMQIGSIEISTHEDTSTVRTPGTQITVDSQSTALVGVEQTTRTTEVVNLRGGASVAGSRGTTVKLGAGEKVGGTKEGTLSGVERVIQPPALSAPADNQIYQARTDLTVPLDWSERAGAKAYQLQVSRSRLFSSMEINAQRDRSRATARVSSEGAFYWRVASIDEQGKAGPFSSFRRFRVTGPGSSLEALEGDKTPPALQVNRPFNIGGQFYLIQGKVEPGSTVFINDEEIIDVSTDGTFKKLIGMDKVGWNTVVVRAVDLAGNQTAKREKVYAEE